MSKKAKKGGVLSSREIIHLLGISLKKQVNFKIKDNELKEKIAHITVNLEEPDEEQQRE